MGKIVFDWITDQMELFSNPLYNYIAITLIGLIAFIVAWRLVGRLYRDKVIHGSIVGSIFHWTIRLLVFVVVFIIASIALSIIRFIVDTPLWVWLALIGAVVLSIIMTVLFKHRLIHKVKNNAIQDNRAEKCMNDKILQRVHDDCFTAEEPDESQK